MYYIHTSPLRSLSIRATSEQTSTCIRYHQQQHRHSDSVVPEMVAKTEKGKYQDGLR
jgi:hypothetical protein